MKEAPLELNSPWEAVKERLKEQDIHLTDEDLVYERGKEDELLTRLQRVMHKEKQEIRAWIESLSTNRPAAG